MSFDEPHKKSDPLTDELKGFAERLDRASGAVSIEEQAAREAAASRRFITRIVLWTWTATVGCFLAVTIVGIWAASASPIAAGILDLIKTAVLPLTTLILGHYLGRNR